MKSSVLLSANIAGIPMLSSYLVVAFVLFAYVCVPSTAYPSSFYVL